MAIQAHWIRASILFSILSLLFLVGFGAQPASAASRPAAAPLADACFVSLNNSGSTDYSSADASALQSAVSAAVSGDTLKVAGTCAGVAPVSGKVQTVYVNKHLTIVGGYAPGAWSAQPNSAANPTVLDAQISGRVVYHHQQRGGDLVPPHVAQRPGGHRLWRRDLDRNATPISPLTRAALKTVRPISAAPFFTPDPCSLKRAR